MYQRRRGSYGRAESRRVRIRKTARSLRAELLEARLALYGETLLGGDLAPVVHPFSTGLDHADSAVRAAIARITTSAPADQYGFLDKSTWWPATPAVELGGAASVESGQLIGLPSFRGDERFTGIDGSGHSVVIIDSGIDLDHPFFGPDSNGDQVADRIVYNADFMNGRPNADDVFGHGTHVSSIIASQDGTYSGVAPGSDIIHLRVLGDDGLGTAQAIESALQWVVANAATYNVAAVNMSLSFGDNHASATQRPDLGLSDELAALAALGVITVSASGNDFLGHGNVLGVGYPSADPSSISVGAVWDADVGGLITWSSGARDNTTGVDRIASFSQRHPDMTTVFAPGAYVTAAAIGGGVVTMSGTSMAAPLVTGVAALAQELAVQTIGRRLTVPEFTQMVELTGAPIFDGDDEDDNVSNSNREYRRLDVQALANALVSDGLSDVSVGRPLMVGTQPVSAGGRARLNFTVANQGMASTGVFSGQIYLSSDAVIDSTDVLLGAFSDALAPGGTNRRLQHPIDVPADIAAGNYYLGVLVDAEGVVTEANESNNAATTPISISAPAAQMWIVDPASGIEIVNKGSTLVFGEVEPVGSDVTRVLRIYNDGGAELSLGSLSLPPGYSVVDLPQVIAPLSSADITVALQANNGDGAYLGSVSFITNDPQRSNFSISVSGVVDHADSAATATPLEFHSSIAASINTPGDRDWFSFNAAGEAEYRIETSLGSLNDTVLRVYDAGGNEVAANDDSDGGRQSAVIWSPTSDGLYYIEVAGKGSSTGTYHLSLAGDDHGNDATTATATSDPSVNPGAIEGPGDIDWFTFSALAGTDYNFEAVTGASPAASLQLFDADGATLLAPAGGAPAGPLIEWRAPATGMYYLAVAGASPSMIGSYQLLITGEDDHGDNAANATSVSVPGSDVGEIEEQDDVDWFAFDAVGGARYEFETGVQGRADTSLRLIDRDGLTELGRDDSGGPEDGSLLQWIAPASGRYFLAISGVEQRYGDYSLSIAVFDDHGDDAPTATSTSDPSNNLGIIASPGDADWFAFEATAGVSYHLEQTAGALSETILSAIDADGQTVLAASAPGSPIEWIAPQSGTIYFSIAAPSGAQLGDYTVRLTGEDEHGDNAANATPLIIPGNMPGALQGTDDHDWFSFTSVAALNHRFEVTLDAPASIRLYQPDGVTLITEASGQDGAPAVIEWTATAGDVYFLEAVETLAAPATDALPPVVNYSLRSIVVGRVPGDYEGDSNVDGHDFLLWQQSVGSTIDLRADGNNDSVVDGADLAFWGVHYGLDFGGPARARSTSMAGAEASALADSGEQLGQSPALPWIGQLEGEENDPWQANRGAVRRARSEEIIGARDRAMAIWRQDDRIAELFAESTLLERITNSVQQIPEQTDAKPAADWLDTAFGELLEQNYRIAGDHALPVQLRAL